MTGRLWAIVALVAVVGIGAGVGIGAAAWAGGADGSRTTALDAGPGAHRGMMDGESGMDAMAGMPGMPGGAMSERAFMRMMVPHHRSAIDMARMALERGQRPEVRGLAEDIAAAQEDEIARMRGWHQEWFGERLVPDASGPHGMVDMSALEAAGEGFDRAFLRMMIPHHASAIVMAEAVMMGEPRAEIGTLAEEIVAAQAKEIGQMQGWREQWYPPRG